MDKTTVALLLFGSAFNIAYLLANVVWNHLLHKSIFVFLALLIPYVALLLLATWRIRQRPHLAFAGLFCLACTGLAHTYSPEWFKANTILKAQLVDDLNHLELVVRSDKSCTTYWTGLKAVSGRYHGICRLEGDVLTFEVPPYEADLYPDSVEIVDDKFTTSLSSGGDSDFGNYFTVTFRE